MAFQMLELDSTLLPLVKEKSDMSSGSQRLMTRRVLEDLLLSFILTSALDRIYVVIDGLDEAQTESRKRLLAFLLSLTRTSAGHVSILVSSRKTTDIRDLMAKYPRVVCSKENSDDIESYVKAEGKKLSERFHISIAQVNEILESLATRSKGEL